MSAIDFDTPEWRAFLELSDAWQDLLAFLAKPQETQFRIGRAMRQQATKGQVYDIPVCGKCGATSVLNPCRGCASNAQLAAYPVPPPGTLEARTPGPTPRKLRVDG